MCPRSSFRANAFQAGEGRAVPPPSLIDFDGQRLSEELMSLGNPKITRAIAQLIAQEVEKELREGEPPLITAEVISDLVRFKLEELGLIELRVPRSRPKKSATEKPMKTIHPFAVRNPSVRIEVKPFKASPRKADFNWSEEGKQALRALPLSKEGRPFECEDVRQYLEDFVRWVAEADRNEEALPDREAAAIHFFNPLASLDFLPGAPLLRTDLKTGKPAGLVRGLSFTPSSSSIFSMLQKIEREQKESLASCLGFSMDLLDDEEKPQALEAALRFLKYLRTSLENRSPQSETTFKQDLFFPLTSSGTPLLSPALRWLQNPENRIYFTLSLGVSGTLWDSPAGPKGSEAKPREVSSAGAPALAEDPLSGLSSPQDETRPRELENLISLFADQLTADAHLRIFFTERNSEESRTPLVKEDLVPSPISPGLFYSDEWVPSGFLNLASMVEEEEISWDRLRRATRQAVHFLDNVIDRLKYPSEEIERVSKANRSLCLGVMGWADLLYLLRIPYNSDEALELASRIAQFIQEEAIAASSELSKTRGVFPNYIGSLWQKRGIPVRNANLTGLVWDPTPSSIAQVASGIEPHSILVAQVASTEGKNRFLIHPFLAQVAKTRNFSQEAVFRKVVEGGGLQGVAEIPQDVQKVFVNSQEIDWEWHLRTAHAFEKHFDQGVAKLCPVEGSQLQSSLEDVLQKAHDLRLKSLFLKRIGAAPVSAAKTENTSLTLDLKKELEDEEVTQAVRLPNLEETQAMTPKIQSTLRPRPERLTGSTYQLKTDLGHLYVTVNEDEKGPFELFTQLTPVPNQKKATPACLELLNTVARMVSYSFQRGVPPQEILDHLQQLGASSSEETLSLTEALSEALSRHLSVQESELEEDEKTEILPLSALKSSAAPEKTFSIFDEVALSQDTVPDFQQFIPPTAACVDCGKPFKKLNGSDSCPECKAAH